MGPASALTIRGGGGPVARMPPSKNWPRAVAVPLLVVAVPILVLAPLLGAEFTNWDDPNTVARNPAMSVPFGDVVPRFWADWHEPEGDIYIPLTRTLWRVIAPLATPDAPAGGGGGGGRSPSPGPFHAINLLCHGAAGLVAFRLIRRLTGATFPAAAGALLFALHPLQVEPVAWVSGLKDVLSGLLCLVALDAWATAVGRAAGGGAVDSAAAAKSRGRKATDGADARRMWVSLGIATLAYVLAMFAKPGAVVLPLLAAVVAWAVLRGRPESAGARDAIDSATGASLGARATGRIIVATLAAWAVLAVPIVLVTAAGQPAPTADRPPIALRPLVAADALAFYAGKVVAPLNLVVDYGRTPARVVATGEVYWTWVVTAGLLAVAAMLRRRAPLVTAGILLFMLAPLPVLGLKPFDFQFFSTVADHYVYLAMLGPALVMAAALSRLGTPGAAAGGVVAVVLVALAVLSHVQARQWHDTRTLFGHNLSVRPESLAANLQLGLLAAERGELDAAAAHYTAALRTRPDHGTTLYNYGNFLLRTGHPAEAIECYAKAMPTQPKSARLRNNAGVANVQLGRVDDARREFEAAAALDPGWADPHVSLGVLAERAGDVTAARTHLQRALQLAPNNATARRALDRLPPATLPFVPAPPH